MNSTLKLHRLIFNLCAMVACALAVSQGAQASTPHLDRISPTRVNAGAQNVTVTLSGTSFAADDQVFINGSATPVQSSSASSITVAVPDAMLTNPTVLNFEIRATDNSVSSTRALVVIDPAKLNAQSSNSVLASSYRNRVSPGAIVTTFGTRLATATAFATSLPLPTSLSGTRVFIGGAIMPLLFVGDDANSNSFGQVNFVLPDDFTAGTTEILVLAGDGSTTLGNITIDTVSPGVFTLNQSGGGLPVALTTTDGVGYFPVWNPDNTPVQVNAGTAQQPTYLAIFGTGWRHRTSQSNVVVTVGGASAQVLYADLQPDFAGLDQLNLVIPPQLAGTGGPVEIVITVDGIEANRTTITIQ